MGQKRNQKEKITKYIEMKDNENAAQQNFWDAAEVVLRGKCISLNAYIRK